jgi:hypothetical protein
VLSLVGRLTASVTFFTLTDHVTCDDVFALIGPLDVDLELHVSVGDVDFDRHFVTVILVEVLAAGLPLVGLVPRSTALPCQLAVGIATAPAVHIAPEVELMAALGPGDVRPPHAQNLNPHSLRVVDIHLECPDGTEVVGSKPLNESLPTNDGARGSPEKGGAEK